MKLVRPSIKYKDDFIQAVKEYQAAGGDDRRDIIELKAEDLEKDFPLYIANQLLQSSGKNLPEGYVPQTTYWLIDDGRFIGRVSIRHTLIKWGHIGYDIRPSERNKGYGKKILELSLPRAKNLGINKVILTCNETNIASKKIIEANGGIFENSKNMGEGKPKMLRYWIDLGKE